jgi:hypothetical protein
MIFKGSDERAIIADHGRMVARLQDDVKILSQRLAALERRVSTIEANLAGLVRLCSNLASSGFGVEGRRAGEGDGL